MTGVDKDLATLPRGREFTLRLDNVLSVGDLEEIARVEAELSRLREERDAAWRQVDQRADWLAKAEARLDEARQECARLQQALVGVASGRCIHSPLITSASPLSRSGNFYSTLPEECPRCIAREALAGLGSGQGPVAGSEAAQDTPACDHEWVQEHGTSGRYCVVCGAGPDTPAEEEA